MRGIGTSDRLIEFPAVVAQTLPRAARLRNAAEFRRVFAERRVVSERLLRLNVAAASEVGAPARLGLAISKRAVASAVARNRLRRQVREAFRRRRARLAPGDYVVTARPGVDRLDRAALALAVKRLFNRFELK